jgi:hypothetical protein
VLAAPDDLKVKKEKEAEEAFSRCRNEHDRRNAGGSFRNRWILSLEAHCSARVSALRMVVERQN